VSREERLRVLPKIDPLSDRAETLRDWVELHRMKVGQRAPARHDCVPTQTLEELGLDASARRRCAVGCRRTNFVGDGFAKFQRGEMAVEPWKGTWLFMGHSVTRRDRPFDAVGIMRSCVKGIRQ
jgi:hypothetical protein